MRTISKLRSLISKARNRFNFLLEKNLLRSLEIISKVRRESQYYFFPLTLLVWGYVTSFLDKIVRAAQSETSSGHDS